MVFEWTFTTSAGLLRRVISTPQSGRVVVSTFRPRLTSRTFRGPQNADCRAGRIFRPARHHVCGTRHHLALSRADADRSGGLGPASTARAAAAVVVSTQ